MSDLKSTVIFISNLYPVEKKYTMDDTIFCQHVEEPNALFKMKCNPRFKWFNFTSLAVGADAALWGEHQRLYVRAQRFAR